MTQLWWVRHLPVSVTGCYIGQSDVEAVIPSHTSGLTKLLPAKDVVWFASPLKRAVATAQWLNPLTHVQTVPELKEQHFGVWEGKSYDQVWREHEHHHDWSQPETLQPPDGESFTRVCERVDGWLNAMLESLAGRSIVIVAHAGVIRAGLRHAVGLSHAQALKMHIDYTSVTHVSYYAAESESARVEYVNRLN